MILNPTCLIVNFLNTLRSLLARAGHRIDSRVARRFSCFVIITRWATCCI